MYFYFDKTTQLWRIGDKDYHAPKFTFKQEGATLAIEANKELVYGPARADLLKRANGTTYGSYETMIAECSPFFGDASEQAYWAMFAEANYSYGVLIDERNSSPLITRIGNLELHKSLPVHSTIKGCAQNLNGSVNYYLKADDWTKKEDGTAANHDGTDGNIMTERGDCYQIFKVKGYGLYETSFSLIPIPGYIFRPKGYKSAYEASIDRTTGRLCSVINTTSNFRGGNNNAAYDGTAKDLRGKGVTNMSQSAFTAAARLNGSTRWNQLLYSEYLVRYWLFVVEYANLNSQAAVVGKNTVTGFMEGGLGDGVTTANGTEWNTFNGYNPFVPCGTSNSLGNGSGEVSYTAIDFGGAGVNRTFKVNRYRGVELPFGHTWKHVADVLIDVKTDAAGGTSKLYRCTDPAKFSSSSIADYTFISNIARTEGYITKIIGGKDGDIMPLAVGGGSTTYYCDYFYRNISTSELKCVLVGGNAYEGGAAGFAAATTYGAPSIAYAHIGARLCYI